jgi:hypothetical protein
MAINTSAQLLDFVELIQNKRIQIMKFLSLTLTTLLSLSLITGCGGGSEGPPPDVYKTTCLPTMAAFKQLYNGMAYSQAVAVIGCEGSLTSDTTVSGVRMQSYEWGDFNAQKPSMVKLWVPFENGLIVVYTDKKPRGAGLL